MPAPYPTKLKQAAVAALERGEGTGQEIADRFNIGRRTLITWARILRERGSLEPAPRGGGNFSRVDIKRLLRVLKKRQDATSDELTRAYNLGLSRCLRVHRSSILRALQRENFTFKKKDHDRPNKTVSTSAKNVKSSVDG